MEAQPNCRNVLHHLVRSLERRAAELERKSLLETHSSVLQRYSKSHKIAKNSDFRMILMFHLQLFAQQIAARQLAATGLNGLVEVLVQLLVDPVRL